MDTIKNLVNFKIIIFCMLIFFLLLSAEVLGVTGTAYTGTGGELSTGTYYLNSDKQLSSAIMVRSGQNVTLDLNGYVLKAYSSDRHAVIYAGGTLTIIDSNPTSSHYGAITDGLWVYNSSATSGTEIKGGIITGGTAGDRGGAFFVAGTLIMNGGTIAGCKSLSNSNSTETNMTTYPVNTFTNGVGGAVFVNENATFTMNDGAIKYCKAGVTSSIAGSGGGAVFVDCEANKVGTFTMNGGIISDCQALNGGAVFVHSSLSSNNTLSSGSVFNMTGGEILNCFSTLSSYSYGGGAVFINATKSGSSTVTSVASFNMSGGILNGNSTNGAGGAVYVLGNFTMSDDAQLIGNSTLATGEVIDEKPVYKSYGGAIFTNKENANFVMNGGTISNSYASSGGGVMVWTGSTFTMNGGTISNCKAYGSGGQGNGGAIYVQSATYNFNGGTLEGNEARRYGGGININMDAVISLNGSCNVINNIANHGGGISQEAGDCQIKLDNENILIKGNKATSPTNTGNGGGLFIEKGVLDISAGSIIGNTADNNGGGISLRVERIGGDITVNMTGGIIKDNIAKVTGGGIDIYADYTYSAGETTSDANRINDVVVNLNEGIFNGNQAYGNGGGMNIYVNKNNGSATMNIGDDSSDIKIENNNSLSNGGGIAVSNGTIRMTDGVINNCSAKENGGAIYLLGGDFTITGGSIGSVENDKKLGSKAVKGGGVYVTGGQFNMNGGTIEGNTATNSGGGIQISDGNVYITAGKISSNVARGEGTDSEDVGYGGGLFVDGGEIVNIRGGEISKNVAARNGGGIEIKTDKDVTVDIYSGSFIDNVADECGGAFGIDCDNGIINVGEEGCDGSSTSSHIHPVLTGNLAGVQGGGFYMSGKDAILNIYCCFIDNNIVVDIENNVDQSSGTVTVYDGVQIGDLNEGVIVIGGTFIDKRNELEQKIEVTYYSNFNGSEEMRNALISQGSSITLPGDIFGVEGYDIVGWTTDPNNVTEIEYSAGQIIEIAENITLYGMWIIEERNEPSFIIVIPTEISFSNDTDKTTFDIEATLNLFPRNKFLNVNIAEEEFKLKILNNGVEVDSVFYEITRDNEKVLPGGVAASFNSDSALVSYVGREQLELKVISNPQQVGYYDGKLTFFASIEDV